MEKEKRKKEKKKKNETKEIEILDDIEEIPLKKEKHVVKNILLIISIVFLLASVALFIYTYNKKTTLDDELTHLKENIINVKEKLTSNEKEKEEKGQEYENLKEELKEKVEEYEIWEELTEKLKQALS